MTASSRRTSSSGWIFALPPADWGRLVADMTEMAGAYGARAAEVAAGSTCAPDPAAVAACAGLVEGSVCSFGTRRRAAAARCCRWARDSPARRCRRR